MSVLPLVTVVMPVFNASATLAQALSNPFWHPKLWVYWVLTFLRPGHPVAKGS